MPDMNVTRPRVTVGMPVYNGKDLFPRAIESILAQSFQDFEIVISDNASNDGTDKIVRRYANRDSRISIFKQPETISSLLNFRFVHQQAKGEFFFWAPHDDWWHPEFLAIAVKTLDSALDAAAVMGVVRYFNQAGKELFSYRPPFGLDDRNTFIRIRSYLSRNVTDHLFYSVIRNVVLDDAHWSSSIHPEKVIIMHILGKGRIMDGWGMEYFNQYAPKTRDEVQKVFQLPSDDARFTKQVFIDLVAELRAVVSGINYVRLIWLLLVRQHWYKFFLKYYFRKTGQVFRPFQRDKRA